MKRILSVILSIMISMVLASKTYAGLPPDYKTLPRDKTVEALIVALDERSINIEFLLSELKEYGNAVIPDLQALLDKYGKLGDTVKVQTLIKVMGYYPSETSIDPLMAQLDRDNDLAVTIFSAISGIERSTKSEKAYKAMLKIYFDYPQGLDWMTNRIVKDADDSRIPYLIQLLNDDRFGRNDVVIERLSDISRDKNVLVLPAITAQLKHGNELVRMTAAEAIANLGGKSSIPALKDALKVEEKVYVKVNMVLALVSLGDFMSTEFLVNLIGSQFSDERELAKNALVEISGKDFGEDQAAWQKWFETEKKARGL